MSTIPVAYSSCPDYSEKTLRAALETVLAPQLAFRGPLHGKSVMLKPNLLAWKKDDDPACVHPCFLVETAKVFLDAGAAKVAILENPAVQSVPSILHAMGIDTELKKLNVPYASFTKFAPMDAPDGVRFHNLELASEYREFDFTADLAKAKTHAMMTLTLCVKNLFGFVNGSARIGWHLSVGRDFEQFADMLLDLYLTIRPEFNLIDSVIAMEGNGPGSGSPVHKGFLAGAPDALALDASAAPILGAPELLLLRRAAARGISMEYENVTDMPDITPLKLPDPPGLLLEWGVALPPFCREIMRNHLLSRPQLDAKKCIGCGLCAKMCPPKAIRMENGKPFFSTKECIRCFCCQEHCPKGAIEPKKSFGMSVMEHCERFVRGCFRKR